MSEQSGLSEFENFAGSRRLFEGITVNMPESIEMITAEDARRLAASKDNDTFASLWNSVVRMVELSANKGAFNAVFYVLGNRQKEPGVVRRVVEELKYAGFTVALNTGFHMNERHVSIKISWEDDK